MRNVTVRLSKTEDPGTIPDGRKRKRAVHETIRGDRLCDAWPTVGTAFCRIAQGDTDYSKARSRVPTARRRASRLARASPRPDRLPTAFRARALTADEQMQGLKPYGLRGLLSLESEMELALFVNERDELVLDLKAFVGTIARASTHKPRRVHIGPDKAIYLTSRPGTVISERPLEMLHENLVRLLWTVAYYRGVGFSEERLWKGPDPSLYGLRLWAVDALRDDAFAGTTTPAEFRVLGTVPPRLPVHAL